MRDKQKEFLRFIKLLSDNNCLEHIILIGSWAEFLYMETGVLPEYEANIRTLDIDFLIKNLRKPHQSISISALAKEEGFLVDQDRLTGTTKIFDMDGLEIEFLIPKIGKGVESSLKTNLGVTAQALRHLELLKKNTIIVKYFEIEVEIPTPEAFVLHKMIINEERKEKIEKDRNVINSMYFHLNHRTLEGLKERLSKKEKNKVNDYIDTFIKPEIEKRQKIEEAKNVLSR